MALPRNGGPTVENYSVRSFLIDPRLTLALLKEIEKKAIR